MRFSIIHCVYNQAHLYPQFVEAMERQTFKDFEVLVCDDGSSDDTERVVRETTTSVPVRYFKQKHKGMRLAKNANQGIFNALGEFCVFIMGDSFPETDFLEVMNEYADEGKGLCGIRINIDNGKAVDIDWRLKKAVIPNQVCLLGTSPWQLLSGNGMVTPTKELKEVGGWNEKLVGYGGEDNDIVARLYYRGVTWWSIPHARIYHHWHKMVDGENKPLVAKLIKSYGL